MPLDNNYKLVSLYVLKVLQEYSDSLHILTQNEICEKIHKNYGMDLNRKTIGATITSLKEFGYDIKSTTIDGKKGCYIVDRVFEPSEIQFLVDAVFSSKTINSKNSQELTTKLSKLLSCYQRKQYNYIYKTCDVNRSKNKELFYNIDLINEAIENNKQISFNYKRHKLKDNNTKAKTYKVNPYCLINNQGKYYLVCNYDYFNDIANYKLEKIYNVKMLDSKIKPITQLEGFENGFDIAKYANENIYMFGANTINATIKVLNSQAEDYVDDWFNNNAKIYEKDGQIYADLKTNETSLLYWCLQYGEMVELVSPQQTKQKLKGMIKTMFDRYFN